MKKKTIIDYINHKKELNEHQISFIYGENEGNDCLFIHNYFQNKQELEFILNLILQISDDNHHGPLFLGKIEQNLSNSELFYFFSSNKKILLFLIQKEIITLGILRFMKQIHFCLRKKSHKLNMLYSLVLFKFFNIYV